MTYKELVEKIEQRIVDTLPYTMHHWQGYNYSKLKLISLTTRKHSGSFDKCYYNDIIITADTETSKSRQNPITVAKDGTIKYIPVPNYVVAWTVSIRAFHHNICTLYGTLPSDFTKCIDLIIKNLNGEKTIIYFHNYPYDYVFLRKFLYKSWGYPTKQLNVKPHYPLFTEFENGVIIKDSYILSQRSLQKWADDMQVEHRKAVGMWDYDKIRTQHEAFTPEELTYIENDTVALAECIDRQCELLNKNICSLPYTATGIPRDQTKRRGKEYNAHKHYLDQCLTYMQQQKAELIFHGGYTHANRHLVDFTITQENLGIVVCKDFNSSYPFVMLSEKMPADKFVRIENVSVSDILSKSDDYAFMFKLILVKPMLKDYDFPMPSLQYSKATKCINPQLDNGRILGCDYIEIYLNEVDLSVIVEQYKWHSAYIRECEFCIKQYLPRWFTDYIFELYTQKTQMKGIEELAIEYSLKKGEINSCYGMCVQKPCKNEIFEDYPTGDFTPQELTDEESEKLYEKYTKLYSSILPFQWGCWVTSYAFRNLFELGKCCETWVYSDTDSCYSIGWVDELVFAYNEKCKQKLINNGYGPVIRDGVEYWLGTAVTEGKKDIYTEFRVLGAKRYCGRCLKDGLIHITVAGVPKKAYTELNDNINNFTRGMIFHGTTSGKMTHSYMFNDDIVVKNSIEFGDSIDLTPCDYLLDSVELIKDWDTLISDDIMVQVYEENIERGVDIWN